MAPPYAGPPPIHGLGSFRAHPDHASQRTVPDKGPSSLSIAQDEPAIAALPPRTTHLHQKVSFMEPAVIHIL